MIAVLVIVLVIGLLVGAFFLFFLHLFESPPAAPVPSVTLGPVGFVAGNATFNVTSVTATAPVGFFRLNLRVGTANGTLQRIELDPSFATVTVTNQRYRVYFMDTGSNLTLGAGDRFTVTGNGTLLPASPTFTFSLLWILDGRMVGSTSWTQSKPLVTFTSVTQSQGNATIGVAGASRAVSPSDYKVTLQVGIALGTPMAMPAVGGAFAGIAIGGAQYRVYWTDIGRERTLNYGDAFRITGNNVALPAATLFTFYLLWSDGSSIQSTSWSTP